jgi:hypothetical protein
MKSKAKQIDSIMAILPKRGDLKNPKCPTREVIDSMTGLWVSGSAPKGRVQAFENRKTRFGGAHGIM